MGGGDALELAREFDATPPAADFEYRARYRRYGGLEIPPFASAAAVVEDAPTALHILRVHAAGKDVPFTDVARARGWLDALKQVCVLYRGLGKYQRIVAKPGLTFSMQEIAVLARAPEEVEALTKGVSAYLQERVVYPNTPGTYHYTLSEDGRRSESESSETGPVFDRVPGRRRPYSDVYQQVANELAHLPNFHARAKLSGSDEPPLEYTFRTSEWPKGHDDAGQRQERQRRNRETVLVNTVRDFTRPRADVVAEFRARYETMLRSIGMSWTPGEPLPKPQVLYEEDD